MWRFCQLPGLDLNQDKESQNPITARRKSMTIQDSRQEPQSLTALLTADPQLARLIEVWPTLAEYIRAAILALAGIVK